MTQIEQIAFEAKENHLTGSTEYNKGFYEGVIEGLEIAKQLALEVHCLECHFNFGGVAKGCRLSDYHTECRLITDCSYKKKFIEKFIEIGLR